MKMLSVEEAREQLAALVEEAKRGEEIVLTENGTPVVEFRAAGRLPIYDRRPASPEEREAIWQELVAGMKKGFPRPVERFSREEIYEERINEICERMHRRCD